VAAVFVLALTACSSGHSGPKQAPAALATHEIAVPLRVTSADIVSPNHDQQPLDVRTRGAVTAVLQQLLDDSVVQPLSHGRTGNVGHLFTTAAGLRAVFDDHGAFFDEGVPLVEQLDATVADVQLSALADDQDHPALVVAKFDWELTANGGNVHVVHRGELSLIPAFGAWLVGAYDVAAARSVNGNTTSTTAVLK
jgi:hypothetical protein